ncbi:protein windpipe [Phlebotomus argentipes]|uniref:protein windpipe n=1 Tax=Phlebotomus argentipes TaxID=94469 RepID=UPI002893475D|nr:protein windpipe [Phlebotomus argentipes]XP_059614987.1 protein windpipe [Phlebotomus argentipes]
MLLQAGLFLLLLATSSATPSCPADCICTPASDSGDRFSHVRCHSADGIAEVGPIAVGSLDLSNAGIVRLTNQLENLQNLTHLDLSNNRLSEANRLTKRILVLNLSFNRITSGKLGKLPVRVQVLNLTHNEITHLPMSLMRLKDLKQLELAGNRINCTCETLQVRNWLQARHVWTDQLVKCHSPLRFKGKSWLQVRQADICEDDRERNIWGDAMDGDNELMMGDAPVSSGDDGDEQDNIEQDYLPYDHAKPSEDEDDAGSGDDVHVEMSVEGSGVGGRLLGVDEASESPEDEDDENYDDGSGSGAIALPPIISAHDGIIDDIFDSAEDDDHAPPIQEPDEEVTRPTIPDLGIFAGSNVPKPDEVTPANDVVPPPDKASDVEALPPSDVKPSVASDSEDLIAPSKAAGPTGPDVRISEQTPEQAEENRATFILLVVVGVALVGLVAFIIVQRKKKRSRRNRADAENPRGEELLEMDKKLLGKPVQKNGNPESAPLMPNRDKSDYARPINGDKVDTAAPLDTYQRPPSPKKVEEPVQKRENVPNAQTPSAPPTEEEEKNPRRSLYDNDGSPGLNNNDTAARDHNEQPLTNGLDHAAPHLHNGEPAEVHDSPEPDVNKYVPKSPALARYSPVYSPETGRVKIKLTETPKPKTPMLVTRSRSNAGDIITTPYTSPIRGQQ